MVEDVSAVLLDSLWVLKGARRVDASDFLVASLRFLALFHRLHVVDSEREHVAVVDCVGDGVFVEAFPEELFGRASGRIASRFGILGENRGAGEAEHDATLEIVGYELVHCPELGAMALIEQDDGPLAGCRRVAVLALQVGVHLLYRRDDCLVILPVACELLGERRSVLRGVD